MKNQQMEQVMRSLFSSKTSKGGRLQLRYLPDPASYVQDSFNQGSRGNKIGNKADKEHERLGPKISEIVKRKLRMLQVGGVKKLFKHFFNMVEGEELVKASHCYISTTSGPIAGILFISTVRVAFCSDKSIKVSLSNGEQKTFHYKVMIPIKKINRVDQSENVMKPSDKYLEIVTKDGFEFWFMGFLNYKKAFTYLQQATSEA